MNEQLTEKSMEIILLSGDAREACRKAIHLLQEDRCVEAEEKMKEADGKIAQAHHIQTACIQDAIEGNTFEYNVLFTHAQDTLMTIYSEIGLAREMMKLYQRLEEKIKNAALG